MRLYINIDHVATVRQARRAIEPDPVRAAVLAELGGADGITVHHRIDIRHVSPRDVELLMRTIRTGLNLEISSRERMVDFAVGVAPMAVTLVPESRQEVTTEGGLDLGAAGVRQSVATALKRFADEGIRASPLHRSRLRGHRPRGSARSGRRGVAHRRVCERHDESREGG